jgi:hypothetical protein
VTACFSSYTQCSNRAAVSMCGVPPDRSVVVVTAPG